MSPLNRDKPQQSTSVSFFVVSSCRVLPICHLLPLSSRPGSALRVDYDPGYISFLKIATSSTPP